MSFEPCAPHNLPETREPRSQDRVMRFLCTKGDTKVVWDPEDASELENAKRQFGYLVKEKGFIAFKTDSKGGKGEQIRTFDEDAAAMILCPPIAGGV